MSASILVVDDEPAIRHLVRDLLIDEGYDVQSAADGQAALDRIAQEPPDLVISDVMMPRRDGFWVLQTLRRAGVTIPVVLMSAAPLRHGVVTAPVIAKPFDLDSLLAQVQRLLAITGGGHQGG